MCWNPYFIVFFDKQCFEKNKLGPLNNYQKLPNLGQLITPQQLSKHAFFIVENNLGNRLKKSPGKVILILRYFWGRPNNDHDHFWLHLTAPFFILGYPWMPNPAFQTQGSCTRCHSANQVCMTIIAPCAWGCCRDMFLAHVETCSINNTLDFGNSALLCMAVNHMICWCVCSFGKGCKVINDIAHLQSDIAHVTCSAPKTIHQLAQNHCASNPHIWYTKCCVHSAHQDVVLCEFL